MKKTIRTSRTAGYLETIFRKLNERYFNGEIEEPIITIQSTPRSYGHVTVSRSWERGDGEMRRELNIGASTLGKIELVVSVMQHEMVHLWQLQNGIKGTSRGGQYHNRRFKDDAEARDLIVSHDPKIGWSITEPGDRLIEFIIEQGWEDISMSRLEGWQASGIGGKGPAPTLTPGTTPKSNSRKMQCPCCGISVRATRDGLRLQCMDCGVQMQYV